MASSSSFAFLIVSLFLTALVSLFACETRRSANPPPRHSSVVPSWSSKLSSEEDTSYVASDESVLLSPPKQSKTTDESEAIIEARKTGQPSQETRVTHARVGSGSWSDCCHGRDNKLSSELRAFLSPRKSKRSTGSTVNDSVSDASHVADSVMKSEKREVPVILCRIEAGIKLPFSMYTLHTCGKCYFYLPDWAFKPARKLP